MSRESLRKYYWSPSVANGLPPTDPTTLRATRPRGNIEASREDFDPSREPPYLATLRPLSLWEQWQNAKSWIGLYADHHPTVQLRSLAHGFGVGLRAVELAYQRRRAFTPTKALLRQVVDNFTDTTRVYERVAEGR